jgi:hypothetical protein
VGSTIENVDITGFRQLLKLASLRLKKVALTRKAGGRVGAEKYTALKSFVPVSKLLCDVYLLFEGLLRVN